MKPKQARQRKSVLSSSRRPGKEKKIIGRCREEAHKSLQKDNFAEDFIYNKTYFRCRFRMRQHLFLHIVDALESHFEYFELRHDTLGRRGLSSLTKHTATMWMLAYGILVDYVAQYLKIIESTAMECMKNFSAGIIQVFKKEYLSRPTQVDVDNLL